MAKIKDLLPIEDGWFGLLIKWDLTTGEFEAQAEGQAINYESLQLLLKNVEKLMKEKFVNKDTSKKEDTGGNAPPWLS